MYRTTRQNVMLHNLSLKGLETELKDYDTKMLYRTQDLR